jgi:hypothetical protein
MRQFLDIEVDELTESVLEVATGKTFKTEVSKASKDFLTTIHKKNGWKFKWKNEAKENNRQVFKLTLKSRKSVLLGLICIESMPDHIHIHLVENSPENVGKKKLYKGIAGNLFAHACMESFNSGFEGVVSFYAKTNLIDHYSVTLGAFHFANNKMVILEKNAYLLVCKYFAHEKN